MDEAINHHRYTEHEESNQQCVGVVERILTNFSNKYVFVLAITTIRHQRQLKQGFHQ